MDPTNITIPEQLQIEIDKTKQYAKYRPRRIEYEDRIGQRTLRINAPSAVNINIGPSSSQNSPRPIESGLMRSLSTKNPLDYERQYTNLAIIKPRILQIDLTYGQYYIQVELLREGIWTPLTANISQNTPHSTIQLGYTMNNLEIEEEKPKGNIMVRFNKIETINLKLWVEEDEGTFHKITFGQDFLHLVNLTRLSRKE